MFSLMFMGSIGFLIFGLLGFWGVEGFMSLVFFGFGVGDVDLSGFGFGAEHGASDHLIAVVKDWFKHTWGALEGADQFLSLGTGCSAGNPCADIFFAISRCHSAARCGLRVDKNSRVSNFRERILLVVCFATFATVGRCSSQLISPIMVACFTTARHC